MAGAPDDSMAARIPPACPANVSQILYHAWHHDLDGLKPLLAVPGRASVQEPTTGETPLHAAIRACAPANRGSHDKKDGGSQEGQGQEKDATSSRANKIVHELFLAGAIWNDVDSNNETPGCLALRLGLDGLYQLCVDAGVRAELLFGLLDGYEELSSEEEEEGEAEGDAAEENGEAEAKEQEEPEDTILESDPDRAFAPPAKANAGPTVTSDEYLRSELTYTPGKLVDDAQNGVMMEWETSIMRASVDSLLGDAPSTPDRRPRILNIGFGMGIVDTMFAEASPARHHIIEAHPAVLRHIRESPDCRFGPSWEKEGPEPGAFAVHAGRWQDVVPRLLEAGELYDAIYFDTFGEDYAQLRHFFTEHVPGLLDEGGAFGFFNGLGADRPICYDVYTRVVEMHLSDAGMDVDWTELQVDMKGLDKEGQGEWEGVRRRYWTLDKYRLPKCTFMG